jgi:hypothetical protein
MTPASVRACVYNHMVAHMKNMQQNPVTVDYDAFGASFPERTPPLHGLEGGIRHGGNANSHYDDPHAAGILLSA